MTCAPADCANYSGDTLIGTTASSKKAATELSGSTPATSKSQCASKRTKLDGNNDDDAADQDQDGKNLDSVEESASPAELAKPGAPVRSGAHIGEYNRKKAAHAKRVADAAARGEVLAPGPVTKHDKFKGKNAEHRRKKAAKAAALEDEGLPPVPLMKQPLGQPVQHGHYKGYFNESKAKVAAKKAAKAVQGDIAPLVAITWHPKGETDARASSITHPIVIFTRGSCASSSGWRSNRGACRVEATPGSVADDEPAAVAGYAVSYRDLTLSTDQE